MPVSHAANSETFKVTTPSDREIVLTRLFDAPARPRVRSDDQARARQAVVGDPRRRILGHGLRDRPPCRRRLALRRPRPRRATPAFYGVYREIAPPERLVYTEIFEPFPDVESVVTQTPHRGGRQDAADGHGDLPVARGARHGPRDRNGERRGAQLRPARGRRTATAAIVSHNMLAPGSAYSAANGCGPAPPATFQSSLSGSLRKRKAVRLGRNR